uniref:BTB domain-containing protein n=1 Tax=Romanomermis culicivorax TaxID=13658 RepID=A0A915HVC6_ROMCU
MTGVRPGNFFFSQQDTAISKGRGRIPVNGYQNQLSIETDSSNSGINNRLEGGDPLMDTEQTIVQNFFCPHSKYENDTVVILSDGQFYVPRVMLFWSSQYFRNLVEIIPASDPDYHYYAQIQVHFQWKVAKDRKFYEILEMIRCLFPCPVQKSVDNKNFRLLLKLSDEYKIANLKHLCQEFLLRDMSCSIGQNPDKAVELFELAAKHNLTNVFQTLLEFFVGLKREYFQIFYEKMDPAMIAVVLDAKLKLDRDKKNVQYEYFMNES